MGRRLATGRANRTRFAPAGGLKARRSPNPCEPDPPATLVMVGTALRLANTVGAGELV
jgi:hypothetical protein